MKNNKESRSNDRAINEACDVIDEAIEIVEKHANSAHK